MGEVTLAEMLDAREARAARQRRLLAAYGRPLLGLNMNIAGPAKRSGLADLAFFEGAGEVRERLGEAVLCGELTDAPTGLEYLWVCDAPAEDVKELAMEIEAGDPVGRLYDLDVLGTDGVKLSRSEARKCLVCGGAAGPCARSRAHGLNAVRAATEELLRDFACRRLSELAAEALIREVELTPKPGLVDLRNSGAHEDMDARLFRRSAESLRPYFRRAVALGLEREDCMPALQAAGREAESAMLAATGGVNTHKGAVYAFGLMLAALGSRLARGGDVFALAAALARAGVPPETATHGSLALARYGAGGARGEALDGFPHVRSALKALENGPYAALLTLLAGVDDTNLLHRGGAEGLAFVQSEAASILAGPAEAYARRLAALDDACIRRRLSPGGCADLLALAFFLKRTENVWREEK